MKKKLVLWSMMRKIQLNNCSYTVCESSTELRENLKNSFQFKHVLIRFRADERCILIIEDNFINYECAENNKNVSKAELSNFSITNKVCDIEELLSNEESYKSASYIGLILLKNPSNHKYYVVEKTKVDIEQELANLFHVLNE